MALCSFRILLDGLLSGDPAVATAFLWLNMFNVILRFSVSGLVLEARLFDCCRKSP